MWEAAFNVWEKGSGPVTPIASPVNLSGREIAMQTRRIGAGLADTESALVVYS